MGDESSKQGSAAGGPSGRVSVDPAAEEKYWRENHPGQPYARSEHGYEHYAPAYRIGYEAAKKYPGKHFDEIEDDLALDYQKHLVRHCRGITSARRPGAAWDKVSGVISPRDPSRGIRGSI